MKLTKRTLSMIFSGLFIILGIPLLILLYKVQSGIKTIEGDGGSLGFNVQLIYALVIVELLSAIGAVVLLMKSKENEFELEIDDERQTEEELNDDFEQNVSDENKDLLEKQIADIKSAFASSSSETKQGEGLLSALGKNFEICQGVFYKRTENKSTLSIVAGYALHDVDTKGVEVELGTGLIGQAAKNQKLITLNSVPEGYMTVVSGLGEANPNNLAIIPIVKNKETIAVIEIASFQEFNNQHVMIFEKVADSVGDLLAKSPKKTVSATKKKESDDKGKNEPAKGEKK